MNYIYYFVLFWFCCLFSIQVSAQKPPELDEVQGYESEIFFNFGSGTNLLNTSYRVNTSVGEPSVESAFGQEYFTSFGFWSRFLLPPSAPILTVSEGDFPDRILLSWELDPLSPPPSSGFNIYRDGAFLATFSTDVRQFIDFNAIAGEFYTYTVTGVNDFGEGFAAAQIGFVNPNGSITGRVTTRNSNPVPDVAVIIEPTIGKSIQLDGVDDFLCAAYNEVLNTDKWTISAWVKIGDTWDNDGILDFSGPTGDKNWSLRTTPSTAAKGIQVGTGHPTNPGEVLYEFSAETADDWHYITASFTGSSLILYVDGDFIGTTNAAMTQGESSVLMGRRNDGDGYFDGFIDDVRIYDRQLPQTEIQMFQYRTANSETEGLLAYWKLDEGLGSKAFDLTANKIVAYQGGGVTYADDRPAIKNAGISNVNGYYLIEGVNYGGGTTFTVKPEKDFYFNQALEFNAANESHAVLPDFDIPDSTTVELWVNAFDLSADQTLLSKDGFWNLSILSGHLILDIGGTPHDFGVFSAEYQHLAFVMEQIGGSSNLEVQFYLNGEDGGSVTFNGVSTDWTGQPWILGANGSIGSLNMYFTGLIDELVAYDGLQTQAEIQEHFVVGTDQSNALLLHNFSLNEGTGTTVMDMGSGLSGEGTLSNTFWSIVASKEVTFPHEFDPAERVATLNPSNTSTDNVDFLDVSTISVSGTVRYENTFCFQEGVEILVNGASYFPPIMTDENGRFVADFEPGLSIILTPQYENHTFLPAFWEIRQLNTPVAGILFQDQTKRIVEGQVAGGLCRKSIIPEGSRVKVKLRTLDECWEKEILFENANGKFNFQNVPPVPMTVAITEHSNPIIFTYFQNLGGSEIDLTTKNDTIDFIYYAPPEVELTALPTNECGDPMLEMLQSGETTIKVFEQYDGGKCYLDTALLTINNEIGSLEQFDTLMTEGMLKHQFRTEAPNIVPPHLKTLQVTAEAHDEFATETLSAVILGRQPRETAFTSTAPEFPTLILRDPPGDASYSFMESGETTCQSWSFEVADVMNTDASITAHLGPDFTSTAGTPFFSVDQEIDVTADLGVEIAASTTAYTAAEMETCININRTISTGDNDLIVGSLMGGDVYMGGAMNFIYGITDELLYDTMNCEYILDKGLYVFPDGFSTTFIYTENHIQSVVIPALMEINDLESADRWQEIIDRNTQLKEEAIFSNNISFDAGVVYEESETSEVAKTITNTWTQAIGGGFATEFGVTANGIGITAGINMSWSTETVNTNSQTTATSRTVGYALADDDIFDNFTINVKKDEAYGTPVFDLVSGQSSCPHEPNTQPRDGVEITADRTVAVNVPMNDVATYNLTLGNSSQSGNTRVYTLMTLSESNPDGAIVRFNGLPLIELEIGPGESLDITMTIARGPDEFNYEDLEIAFFAPCEDDRADALGIDVDETFFKTLAFNAQFLEPCSRVDLGFPLQDWVLTPEDGNILFITANDYDVNDADLELIRVQYRRTQGDGAWINIAEIQKADLGEVFEIIEWDTEGLKDGLYEVRAITQCFGAQNAGISHIIKGKIERTAPEIFGIPEPADGILHAGDEISITFTEPIQCEQLIQADVLGNNNIGLYDAATGNLIDAIITCNEDKIIIVPNLAYQFLENYTLRVEVDNIKDLANNTFVHTDWEFFVDRNALNWLGGDIEEAKIEGTELIITRELENRGGSIQNFEMTDVPAWANVFPLSGSIAPGASELITFVFPADMVNGDYTATMIMNGVQGDEPLDLEVRVVCEGPDWAFDPSQYIYTMNFTLQLDIEGEMSEDKLDRVAAFVDGELRGVSNVQFEPNIPVNSDGTYFAFLTVYSNELDGETLDFQIWDVSACVLYGEVIEAFDFFADEFIGTPLEPQVIHTNNMVLSKIPIHAGWNWISYNLDMPDTEINAMLASLMHPNNGLIKGQTQFSQYFDGGQSWVGSLQNLSHETMYQYRSDLKDTLTLVGAPIDPSTVDIPIVAGWNWIGYLPQRGQPLGTALASLTPLNGDIIKSQIAFAQYVAGVGWIGNLNFMESPNGYLLKISNAGTLTYPANFTGTPPVVSNRSDSGSNIWEVFPQQFEHTMNMIAMVQGDESNLLEEGDEIGVFVGEEVRGSARPIYVEDLDAYMVFLTVYANEEGEDLSFKFADASHDAIYDIHENHFFAANDVLGSVEAPQPLTLSTVSSTIELADHASFAVYPNPAKEQVYISFATQQTQQIVIRITDALGREVERLEVTAQASRNILEWLPKGLSEGMYFISLDKEEGTETRKVRLK